MGGYKTDFVYNRDLGKWINMTTGECLDGGPIYVAAKVKLAQGWFMAFQEAFKILAKDRDFTGENYRVLNYLFSKLAFENFIEISQKEIGIELGMQKQHVNRSIKMLCTKGIIQRAFGSEKFKGYKLNPHFGWKGSVKSLTKQKLKIVIDNEKS